MNSQAVMSADDEINRPKESYVLLRYDFKEWLDFLEYKKEEGGVNV